MFNLSFKKSSGVTLIELLVVLAIAAILAQLALPDFRDILQNNRSAARINELQTSLTFARSEAIKRNTPVMLCKSTNGTSCQDSVDAWQTGWIVFADANGNDNADNGEVLTLHGNAAEQFTLTFTAARVAYNGSGMTTAGQSNTFTLCDDRGETYAKGVIIGASGRARLAVDSDDLACS
ncbi:MAG: GspH/FimT family pseudopilin [Xanthomonadales bacterium]|nr:GspH/FimT family pseudopilin [Xanthomonadales bacterium]